MSRASHYVATRCIPVAIPEVLKNAGAWLRVLFAGLWGLAQPCAITRAPGRNLREINVQAVDFQLLYP